MQIGVIKETAAGETRVASSPDTVKKLTAKGLNIVVERSAGVKAHFTDENFQNAGAKIVDRATACKSDFVFKINRPAPDEIALIPKDATVLALLGLQDNDALLKQLSAAHISAVAMEKIPRISRAQSMDALSSQANIAGYRAVIEAARLYGRFFPMMMTSAGSSKAARTVVLGAGVAGLQAIATARRLGAQVWAYDIRPEVKEQIQSLGAKTIELDVGESGSGQGGYAKALSEDAAKRQQQLLGEELKKADIIISTAMIPGKKAPVLIREDVVQAMRPGSVIVDLAAASGGNCPLTEADQITEKHDVVLCGITNFPALVPSDASAFYGRNLMNLLLIMLEQKDGGWRKTDWLADEITKAALVVHEGQVRG